MECYTDDDCPGIDSICIDGECREPADVCTNDADCEGGFQCLEGRCVPIQPECRTDSDCSDPGYRCEDGQCVPPLPTCASNADCDRFEVCEDGLCVPIQVDNPIGRPCQDHEDCEDGDICIPERLDTGEEGWPGGYCTRDCMEEDCPTGSTCYMIDTVAICFFNCDNTAECRDEYVCYTSESIDPGVCLPRECYSDADCDGELVCAGGFCVEPDPQRCTSDDDCLSSEQCVDGNCIPRTLTDCSAQGAACDPTVERQGDFLCLDYGDGAGVCTQRCDPEAEETCQVGSICIPIQSSEFPGVCLQSDCTSVFNSVAECGDGTCYPVGNDAYFCIDAGTAGEGEVCSWDDDILCQQGLLCSDTCFAPCDVTDPTACAIGSCIPLDDDFGFCGEDRCEPFTADACPQGESCYPATEGYECMPTGLGAQGDACLQDTDCGADMACFIGECYAICDSTHTDVCPAGLSCIDMSTDTMDIGVCTNTCDLFVAGTCQTDAKCWPGGVCGPAGDDEVLAEGCDFGTCIEGAYCAEFTDGSRTCLEYCEDTYDCDYDMDCYDVGGSGWGLCYYY